MLKLTVVSKRCLMMARRSVPKLESVFLWPRR